MLPTTSDNGAKLAEVLPTALESIARSLKNESGVPDKCRTHPAPATSKFVVIVVDGLGWSNFQARRGHARNLAEMIASRIETVHPTTTGAALTSITTGMLPGQHGLAGYRIRHPKDGIVTTLTDWQGYDSAEEIREWQLSPTVFEHAASLDVPAYAIGRPAHSSGGFTRAVLTGAEYVEAQTIEERFQEARRLLEQPGPALIYLYIDELDRAGHSHGSESEPWLLRLEQLDSAYAAFMALLPRGVGVCLTADHGMVDGPAHQQILLDETPGLLDDVAEVGGEPRLRYLYLSDPLEAVQIAARVSAILDKQAWVFTRQEAVEADIFGPMAPGVADRIGDVIVAARKRVTFYLTSDDPKSRAMVGQHGSFTDEERGIPLMVSGDINERSFINAVRERAALATAQRTEV